MTLELKRVQSGGLNRYVRDECYGLTETTANTNAYTRDEWSLPKESRPLPDPPLWQSPTGQSEQYTEEFISSQYHHVTLRYWSGVCHKLNERYDEVFVHPGNIWMYPDVSTNWQLPFRLRVKDISVNLASNVAEYRESARMFSKAGTAVVDAWKVFRKKQPRRRKITPCDIPASYLAYNWGVKPLTQDLYDTVAMLDERLQLPLWRRIYAKGKSDGKESGYGGTKHAHWTCTERAVGYVKLLPNYSGITAGNPLEWVWEAIPYSFVLDWMFNIGDTLSALDALKGVESVIGTVTRKWEWEHHYNDYLGILAGIYEEPYWLSGSPPIYRRKSHQRWVINDVPLPQVPSWDPSDSYKSIVNALALLAVINPRCENSHAQFN